MLQGEGSSSRRARRARRPPGTAAASLSRRQREVLELLANGIPAREIAVRLGLAETTVRNHIRHLLRKLGCHSQLEAVAVAYRLGLLGRAGVGASATSLPGGHADGSGGDVAA